MSTTVPTTTVPTTTVPTTMGPREIDALGVTLMHEHVFLTDPELVREYPQRYNWPRLQAAAIDRFTELRRLGVSTVVDMTVLGLGRDVRRVAPVAAASGVAVIVATGSYVLDELPLTFRFRGPGTIGGGPEPLTELFIADIETGIADTGIRAGVIKCATGTAGLTPGVLRGIRAAAWAHRATGAPISTHAEARTRRGLDQQRVLAEEGVDLSRVVIGHCGDSTDLDYLLRAAERGSYLGMDTFGLELLVPFEQRVRIVAQLCQRGLVQQLVLSQDAVCFSDWLPAQALRRLTPRWNHLHLMRDVLPALRAAGVSEEFLQIMLVENPRRIFQPQPGY